MIEDSGSSGSPAFVAGATGFTGREVVRILREQGINCVAHVRPESPRVGEWKERFEKIGAQVDTTAWQEEALAETMKRLKPAYIFALLGTTRARMKQAARQGLDPQTQNYDSVDYGLTSMLIRGAKAGGSEPRFIYLSATGVSDRATSAYYVARRKAEKELMESGLAYTIARPSFIGGPGRDDKRRMEIIGILLANAFFDFAGFLGARKISARYRSTTNTILAKALVRLALDPKAENRIFESEELKP